jgi:hypothetical protein
MTTVWQHQRASLVRVGVVWLLSMLSAGTAAAQDCDGVEVAVGTTEQRCLKPGAGQP